MQIGEILDGSFNIYRRHFGLFMRLSLLLICVPAVVGVYLFTRFVTNPFGMANAVQENIGLAIVFGLIALLVWTTISLLLKSGTIRIISDSYLGHEPSLGAALRFGVSRIIPLLLVAVSKGLLLMLIYLLVVLAVTVLLLIGRALGPAFGGVLGFAGGVAALWFIGFVLCGYALTSMVVVLEDLTSSFDAFGRSWELTKGSRLKVFLVWFVVVVFAQVLPWFVVAGIGQVIGPQSPVQPFLGVLTILMGVATAPILPCALTLLYYDLRVRREAFDLQILSEQLETR